MASAAPTPDEQGFDERAYRAATEYILCVYDAPGMYYVYSQDGEEYVVDVQQGVCECPDHEYRGVECKHIKRVNMERGNHPVPDGVRIDPLLADRLGRDA